MPIYNLPPSPNLVNLKKQAKALLKSVHAREPQALERVGPYFGNPGVIQLQQAHLVLAREFGFSSWSKLKAHIEGGTPDVESAEQRANRFLDLVTVVYSPVADSGASRLDQAQDLLKAHPEIRTESIYTAAAIGDAGKIDDWLNQNPDLIDKKGGYFNWEPIMYAAYARLPGQSSFPAAHRLLERGANPNAHYMWGGQYKFTALTGVFGEGEGGPEKQPEHADMVPFARALLERGASPNDSQAAYNRCFTSNNTCLELLLEYGLSAKDKNNWFLMEDDKLVPHPSETMHFQLMNAIRRGFTERAQLLIDHGADLNKPDDTYDTRTKGKTPWQAAVLHGQTQIADALRAAGADTPALSPSDRFDAACMTGNTEEARSILAINPELTSQAPPRQNELLCDAAKLENIVALQTMIALDFNLNQPCARTPLHEAALNDNPEIVQLLLDAGADAKQRDAYHLAPPVGWALHAGHERIIAILDQADMDIFTAAARGNLKRLTAHLSATPNTVNMTFAEVRPPKSTETSNDWMTPIVYAVLNDRAAVVETLLTKGADPTINNNAGISLTTLANEHASNAVQGMIHAATTSWLSKS